MFFPVVFHTKNCAFHSGKPTVSSVYLFSSTIFTRIRRHTDVTNKTDKPDGKPVLCQRTFSSVLRAVFFHTVKLHSLTWGVWRQLTLLNFIHYYACVFAALSCGLMAHLDCQLIPCTYLVKGEMSQMYISSPRTVSIILTDSNRARIPFIDFREKSLKIKTFTKSVHQ